MKALAERLTFSLFPSCRVMMGMMVMKRRMKSKKKKTKKPVSFAKKRLPCAWTVTNNGVIRRVMRWLD